MNTFALEVWDDEASRCTFYTVRWEDSQETETDRFFAHYDANAEYEQATGELLAFILGAMGEDHGANELFFNRHENEVKGLPVKGKVKIGEILFDFPGFPLRLYALKVSEEIVILFNGGVKDGPDNQTSSLHLRWKEACSFAKVILNAINDGTVLIDHLNRKITLYNGSTEIYL